MFGPFGLAAWPAKESGALFLGCQCTIKKLLGWTTGPVYPEPRGMQRHILYLAVCQDLDSLCEQDLTKT